ncbi:hypothetical protein C8F01DRAFT_1375054 [Mycena amicta]|nr:hypothetical protein C8F01DRAFT_1375054 [Mycena amicta]
MSNSGFLLNLPCRLGTLRPSLAPPAILPADLPSCRTLLPDRPLHLLDVTVWLLALPASFDWPPVAATDGREDAGLPTHTGIQREQSRRWWTGIVSRKGGGDVWMTSEPGASSHHSPAHQSLTEPRVVCSIVGGLSKPPPQRVVAGRLNSLRKERTANASVSADPKDQWHAPSTSLPTSSSYSIECQASEGKQGTGLRDLGSPLDSSSASSSSSSRINRSSMGSRRRLRARCMDGVAVTVFFGHCGARFTGLASGLIAAEGEGYAVAGEGCDEGAF